MSIFMFKGERVLDVVLGLLFLEGGGHVFKDWRE